MNQFEEISKSIGNAIDNIMNHSNFLAIDLEMNQPSSTIIQIGAALGSITVDDPIERLSVIINPKEPVDPYITRLTGISDYDTNLGVSLEDGYQQLLAFIANKNTYINPVTWGGNDAQTLREQLNLKDDNLTLWPFGRRIIDSKTVYVSYCLANKKKPFGGLHSSMKRLKLDFIGDTHNAADDAVNTLRTYRTLLTLLKIKK